MRENGCLPYGTRVRVPILPGTSVPGYHMPPLRGWILAVFIPHFSGNPVFTQTPKLGVAALEALRRPKSAPEVCPKSVARSPSKARNPKSARFNFGVIPNQIDPKSARPKISVTPKSASAKLEFDAGLRNSVVRPTARRTGFPPLFPGRRNRPERLREFPVASGW
jgi:hypothetical protein